ncbi:MAG: hypothetical protein IPG12_15050 [Saprospiraceae bacterium]|nr:hypothetical protein [Saprospiraceae bacterium]
MMDLISYPDYSKVWIYAASEKIQEGDILETYSKILDFAKSWSSHNIALRATGGLLHNRFIVFVVDDGFNNPGGCSIDKSVHFVKSMGTTLNLDFFNRNLFYYLENEVVKTVSKDQLLDHIKGGIINDETLFFDTLVQSKIDFQKSWLKPFKRSWHSKLI